MIRLVPAFVLLAAPVWAYEIAPDTPDFPGAAVLSAPLAGETPPKTPDQPFIDITLLVPATTG